LGSDCLEESDWISLQEIADYLEPFYQSTLELQGQAKTAQYWVIWEALPAIEGLLGYLEKLKVTVPKTNKPLREAVNNAWINNRRTRAAVSSVTARLTASTAGSAVRSLVDGGFGGAVFSALSTRVLAPLSIDPPHQTQRS